MKSLSPTVRARLGRLWPALLVGAAALLLYAGTAAPGLTWAHDGADGGDLITAVATWGVPHPSGYPAYVLFGRLFALLPLGSMARRMNLFSATAAAASVVLVYLTAAWALERSGDRRTWREVLWAAGAALAYTCGPTLWSQAVIAEVYAFAALSFALCLYLALRAGARLSGESGGERLWGMLGLALGVGLGGHLTLLLALPGLALLLWPGRTWRRLGAMAAGLALGLGVYLYLPLAAARGPVLNWGDPSRWRGFWWLVSGRFYHGYAFGLPLRYLPQRVVAWATLWGREFAWVGLPVAALGLWSWWEGGLRRLAVATSITVALYSAYAITYDTTDSYVYLIPALAVTAIWLAEGLRALAAGFLADGAATCGWLLVAVVLAVGLPAWSLASNYRALELRNDREAVVWVDAALAELPSGALLITGQDGHTFALDYACWVDRRCADVLVVDGDLLEQDWYRAQLARRYPALDVSSGSISLADWVAGQLTERRVFLGSARRDLEERYAASARGVLWELVARK